VIRIGPFILEEPIGRGGMAEVWGAVHEREGAPAAVKILTGEAILNPMYQSLFRAEVKGIAGLDHPHIVRVFDHGLLTPEAAAASGGSLQAGSPWLAMERLDGGTLADYAREGVTWDQLRTCLLATLDGLAHAHARGVIHRDIKPGNVLLGTDGAIKLTDFGLVHAIAAEDEVGDSMLLGTPAYMAPEQLQMRARDFGPWTDLYAVGCMAWTLATGAPPFGRELQDALAGHLHGAPPAFEPDLSLPADFEPWIRWLLTRPIEQRVSRAAEASDALASLDGHPRPTWRVGWRRPSIDVERPLHGVGLGLLGVRSVSMTGRRAEQDFLWNELVATDQQQTSRVVLLRGAAGYGKTRLAQWLAERAHELGAAEVLQARWSPAGGAALVDMLARDLATDGLQRPEVQARVKTVLKRLGGAEPEERETLTELLSPLDLSLIDEDDLSGARREPVPEAVRRQLLLNHLRRRAHRRPLVLVLDDVQWGFEGLVLVRTLLDGAGSRLPVLVLCTIEDEAVAEQPAPLMELGRLEVRERVSTLHIGPLDRRSHERLVEGLLGLDAGLASRVQRRTTGNPGFTLDLVADWIQKGLLELGPAGYRLKGGIDAPMPLDLYERWWRRLERALVDRPEQDPEALEVAALLGQVVYAQEWKDVCRGLNLRAPPSLVRHLIDQKLVVAKDGDPSQPWSFTQPMLRATLERRAQERGRALRIHQECAHVLAQAGARSAERVGLHLAAASLPDDALPHLTRAARRRLLAGDFPRAEELIQSRRDALLLLTLSDRDRDFVEQRLLEAELARRTARLPRALSKADEAGQMVRTSNALDLLPAALHEQASALLAQGELSAARQALSEALERATAANDRELAALCLRGLCEAALRLGRVEESLEHGRQGVSAAQVAAEPLGIAEARMRLSESLMAARELPEALNRLRQARRAFQHLGARAGLAESLGLMGLLAFRQRAFDRAEQCYLRAGRQLDDLGATAAPLFAARRGFALIEMGQLDEAAEVLTETGQRADDRALSLVMALADAGLLAVAARQGDHDLYRRSVGTAAPLLLATRFVDLDIARSATRAAKEGWDQGWSGAAIQAARLALSQWDRLGRGESKDALRLRGLLQAARS